MPTLERSRSKHNDLVAQLNKATVRRDNAIGVLVRAEAKRNALIRAVVRSQKRLVKAATVAQVNAPMDAFEDIPGVMPPPETPKHACDTCDDGSIPSFLRR